MQKESLRIWLKEGYVLFAADGPSSLKVEVMAKQVGNFSPTNCPNIQNCKVEMY